jgi:hypothetical protein
MNLADLRRVTVKKRLRIRFALSNGMECILNEYGVAQIPDLHAVPAFNLEEELGSVQQFLVESAAREKDHAPAKPRTYTRAEMLSLTTAGTSAEAGHEEHDE